MSRDAFPLTAHSSICSLVAALHELDLDPLPVVADHVETLALQVVDGLLGDVGDVGRALWLSLEDLLRSSNLDRLIPKRLIHDPDAER